jgi:2-polyprenyl-3-methyl-5-hydroxy-6-metoxy-1,4-benzoquinol methylase
VADTEWALRLFRRSVLKQRKLAEIEAMLGPTAGLRCLDLGSDNGVVSLLLRRRGGDWASADMTEESVDSIRDLVGSDVHRVDGQRLPFADAGFDRVVVVDMLEHVDDDGAFVLELSRILKPGGRLVVNTPHLQDTALRRLRHRLGQTDERHGHVRPGYTMASLAALLEPRFVVEGHRTYSRSFTELVDTVIQLALSRTGKKGSAKGVVVTGADLKRHRTLFRAYSVVYPVLSAVSRLDALLPSSSGYMLIAAATRRG